jgi:hypothetical protein
MEAKIKEGYAMVKLAKAGIPLTEIDDYALGLERTNSQPPLLLVYQAGN